MNCLDTHPFLYGTRYCCDKDTQCDVLGSVGFSDGLCNLVEDKLCAIEALSQERQMLVDS